MKKSIIWSLTIIMSLAFIAFIYVQISYMENMIEMRNEQFSESAMRSLNSVCTQLERDETTYFLEEDITELGLLYPNVTNSKINSYTINPTESTYGKFQNNTSNTGDNKSAKSLTEKYENIQETLKGHYLYQKRLLDEVIFNIIAESSNRPTSERADSSSVRKYLYENLKNNGLDVPFEFAVYNRAHGLIYKTNQFNTDKVNSPNVYSQVLFPYDPVNKMTYLKVEFPTKRNIIFSSVGFMIPALIFSFLLLVIFIITITIAFRQKHLTEMKNDFINNMTHEFKTPISTISLAAQMLNDESVRKSPAMLHHTATVISDETKRLRFQVEKVLQMSLFTHQKATYKLQEVDANNLIDNVVHTFKLKVERYGGSLEKTLDAEDSIIKVDEMHFTNVIFNLLDNAVKYRKDDEPLNLKVSTNNLSNEYLQISISDNGIGIKKEDIKRIFDKFYRVSTGNRHDVKGFGLGLAYVHKIITELNGEISVESEYNKGSRFIIKLPLIK